MHTLSIIIPHFNSPHTLKNLLDSILCESVDTQIIVVDDNSTEHLDEYKELISVYGDRVEFFSNDTGIKGAGTARNIGLEKAEGAWLLFADSDDIFLKGWMAAVKSYFEKEYDIVFFRPTSRIMADNSAGVRHKVYEGYVIDHVKNTDDRESELYLRYFFIVPWSKLIRRSVVFDNNISFDEVKCSNDVMFSVKSGFFAKKIASDERLIYCAMERDGSLTRDDSPAAWEIRCDVFGRRNLFLKDNLSKADYKFYKKRMGSFGLLASAVLRGCGFRYFLNYCSLYRKYKVSIISSALYTLGKLSRRGNKR